MLFGHNSNVTVGTEIVHVQTEDRGANHAFIDTTVHWKGRVLHRRTNNYQDLLPLEAERETAVKARLDEQHRGVIEEIRSGALQLTFPAPPVAVPASSAAKPASEVPAVLKVELINAKNWLSGRQAILQLMVRDSAGNAVSGAETKARVHGVENPAEFTAMSGDDGSATLQFEMPKPSGADVALAIEATLNGAKGQLRFQVRAKPRV
jgi:hypothetical protein